MKDKPYFATPEEILARKNTLFYQDLSFAADINHFLDYLEKKKMGQKEKPNYSDRDGINVMTDFLRQAEKGLSYNPKTADKESQMSWKIMYKKAYNQIKLLAKDQDNKDQVELVLTDLSNLINNIKALKVVPNETLEFYITHMNAFEKTIRPGDKWYEKGMTVS